MLAAVDVLVAVDVLAAVDVAIIPSMRPQVMSSVDNP